VQRKLRIGFDFHGTVVDIQKLKELFSQEFFGMTISGQWLKRNVLPLIGLNEKRYNMLLEYVVERFSYFQHAEGLPDAITTIQSLEDQEHALFMITASGDRAFSSAQQWCKAHDIFHPPSEMYSVDRYNSKAELVDALKLDVFVDNNLDQLTMIRQHFLNKDKIMPFLMLMTDQHNRDLTVPDGITRVDDWDKCYEYIDTLANIDELLSR